MQKCVQIVIECPPIKKKIDTQINIASSKVVGTHCSRQTIAKTYIPANFVIRLS